MKILNMEHTIEDLKISLEYLYKNLLLPTTNFHAENCYRLYTEVVAIYDKLRSQQFNIEAWKIKAQIGKDKNGEGTATAVQQMKDDVEEMYRRAFKVDISSPQST